MLQTNLQLLGVVVPAAHKRKKFQVSLAPLPDELFPGPERDPNDAPNDDQSETVP